jgi:phage I-like protein
MILEKPHRTFIRYRNGAGAEMFALSGDGIIQTAEKPPEWLPLVIEGTYFSQGDDEIPTIIFDQARFDAIIAGFNYDVAHQTFCPIDQNHALMDGVYIAEALGMIDQLKLEGQPGSRLLSGHVRYWTAEGAQKATGGGLPYISIALLAKHPVLGTEPILASVALCASPYMRNIGPYLALTSSQGGPQTQEERKMSKKLFALLGLKDDGTEDQAVEKAQALQKGAQAFSAVLEKVGLKEATVEQIGAAFTAQAIKPLALAAQMPETATADELKAKIGALSLAASNASELATKFAATAADVKTMKAEKLIERAKSEGLVTPAGLEKFSLDAKADPDAAEKVLNSLATFGVKLPVAPATPDASPPANGQMFTAGAVAAAKNAGRDEKFLQDNVKVPPPAMGA